MVALPLTCPLLQALVHGEAFTLLPPGFRISPVTPPQEGGACCSGALSFWSRSPGCALSIHCKIATVRLSGTCVSLETRSFQETSPSALALS